MRLRVGFWTSGRSERERLDGLSVLSLSEWTLSGAIECKGSLVRVQWMVESRTPARASGMTIRIRSGSQSASQSQTAWQSHMKAREKATFIG